MTVSPPALTAIQLEDLAGVATGVLADSEPIFHRGIGAAAAVTKGAKDYATEVDLELERTIGAALTEHTGYRVFGEEFGGADFDGDEPIWVIDPIDGTANYMHSSPMCGMNCALVLRGESLIGLTWLPLLGQRYLAVNGRLVRRNGEPLPRRTPARLAEVMVGVGNPQGNSELFPTGFRLALLDELLRKAFRVRLLGSAALDLAWVASGEYGATVQFTGHPWDFAPGDCLVRAVGGTTSLLSGEAFHLRGGSMLAAAPGVADEIADVVAGLGDPAGYRD